jgi:hypothetical protein
LQAKLEESEIHAAMVLSGYFLYAWLGKAVAVMPAGCEMSMVACFESESLARLER